MNLVLNVFHIMEHFFVSDYSKLLEIDFLDIPTSILGNCQRIQEMTQFHSLQTIFNLNKLLFIQFTKYERDELRRILRVVHKRRHA